MINFYWETILKDGQILKQFDEKGENTFALVMEHKSEIEDFRLISNDNSKIYNVNLATGEFNLDGFKIKSSVKLEEVENKEPIFWRRNLITYSAEEGGKEPVIVGYIIGWQANIDGKNFQQQFMIKPNGDVILMHKI